MCLPFGCSGWSKIFYFKSKSVLENNINTFYNVMYLSNKQKVKHFLFASTSSVYGSKTKFPKKKKMNANELLSFYAATKKCNEVMAYSFLLYLNLKLQD